MCGKAGPRIRAARRRKRVIGTAVPAQRHPFIDTHARFGHAACDRELGRWSACGPADRHGERGAAPVAVSGAGPARLGGGLGCRCLN